MKVKFNKLAGKIIDSGFALYFIVNDNYSQIMARYNLKTEPDIEKAIKYLKSKLSSEYNFMELFFRDESLNGDMVSIGPPFLDTEFVFKFKTVGSYLDFLRTVEEVTIKEEFIKSLMRLKKEEDLDMIRTFLHNEDKLIEYIDTLVISSDLKWKALRFIRNPMEDMEAYIALLEEYFYICETPKMKKYQMKFERLCNSIEEMDDNKRLVFLKENLIKVFKDDVIKDEVYLTILFFNFACVLLEQKGDTTTITLGYKFNEVIEEMAGQNEIDKKLNAIKNMSDATRFKILLLLKNEELFGQQIAEKIGITLATVSYHMTFLFAGDMVEAEERGHRTYYKLKKETFYEIGEFIKTVFSD